MVIFSGTRVISGGISSGSSFYPTVELPTFTEARDTFDQKMNRLAHKFINESVRADNLGAAAIEAGDYVTLEELERMIDG